MRENPTRLRRLIPILFAAALLSSCAAPLNFTHPGGPRWARQCDPCASGVRSAPLAAVHPVATPANLRVVTFNVKFAKEVDKAARLLQEDPSLRGADVVFLQEMDAEGTKSIARRLGMGYVYYPATVHPMTGKLFGNAILSRWPLRDDRKIILPHVGRFGSTQRIAVSATADVAGEPVRLYSVHIATSFEVSPTGRREQAQAVLTDAETARGPVIVAGDFNSRGLGELFAEVGYDWPTADIGWTCGIGTMDHIFLRGFAVEGERGVGKVADNLGASDHKPVWAVIKRAEAGQLSLR